MAKEPIVIIYLDFEQSKLDLDDVSWVGFIDQHCARLRKLTGDMRKRHLAGETVLNKVFKDDEDIDPNIPDDFDWNSWDA